MRRKGHRPRRSCLGCGERDDQRVLIRLVARGPAELRADRAALGRGGYLHKDENCWRAFLRRKSLYRAFHLEMGKEAKEILIRKLRERHWE